MKRSNTDGFTLIELLVVISIIGVLSAVVLTGLDEARKNAKQTLIKQQVRSLVTLLELNYLDTNTFSDAHVGWFFKPSNPPSTHGCASATFTGPKIDDLRKICQTIEDNVGDHSGWITTNAYMFWGIFNDNGGVYWPKEKNYSVLVMFDPGTVYCANNSGKTYLGPWATDKGWFAENGCPNYRTPEDEVDPPDT